LPSPKIDARTAIAFSLRCFRTAQGGIRAQGDSQQILSFYMGKNTPERKDYIMENLVVRVEE
jgi:hypothetical protein